MQKPYDVKIDLYAQTPKSTTINYIVGDAETMPLTITLTAYNKAYSLPEGAIVTLNMQNPEGILFPRLATIADGVITYSVLPEDIAIHGNMVASVLVTSGMERLSWQGFRFSVSRSLTDGQTLPPEYLQPWAEAITSELSDHEGRITALENGAGGNLPVGGTTGQVLSKASENDYDFQWSDTLTGDTEFVLGEF